ncbi:MAG: hypothetical protein LBN02_04670, partial [Oscillospiraceae bacterium]|nr:hypothetical protein [Oscillospiraceae bacterium]
CVPRRSPPSRAGEALPSLLTRPIFRETIGLSASSVGQGFPRAARLVSVRVHEGLDGTAPAGRYFVWITLWIRGLDCFVRSQ